LHNNNEVGKKRQVPEEETSTSGEQGKKKKFKGENKAEKSK